MLSSILKKLSGYGPDSAKEQKDEADVMTAVQEPHVMTEVQGPVNKITLFPNMSNEAFVDFCYTSILKRKADDSGKESHLNALENGASREDLISGFLTSEENNKLSEADMGSEFVIRGHFYSPLPDLELIENHYESNSLDVVDEKIIDWHLEDQKELLKELSQYYADIPFSDIAVAPLRYGFVNNQFGHGDAIMLYYMMRHFKPKNIIEVGSGHSSAVMLDTNQLFLDSQTNLTFIEPYAERLHSILTESDYDNTTIIEQPVQEVDVEIYQQLNQDDILFIDCSHVMKFGSDFGHLLFSIVPYLKKGVIIHFHDILWPFEYPKAWLMEGRAWNEAYLIRAFLSYNKDFEILYFNDFMARHEPGMIAEYQSMALENPGCGLWLRKVA